MRLMVGLGVIPVLLAIAAGVFIFMGRESHSLSVTWVQLSQVTDIVFKAGFLA